MARIQANAIEFDGPATIQELIDALTELREKHGADFLVRGRGESLMESSFDANGPHITKIAAERPEPPKETRKERKARAQVGEH